jgi:hypothetical protein
MSSCWNASKFLPSPGNAMTDGPAGGATVQAHRKSVAAQESGNTTRGMDEVPDILCGQSIKPRYRRQCIDLDQ